MPQLAFNSRQGGLGGSCERCRSSPVSCTWCWQRAQGQEGAESTALAACRCSGNPGLPFKPNGSKAHARLMQAPIPAWPARALAAARPNVLFEGHQTPYSACVLLLAVCGSRDKLAKL